MKLKVHTCWRPLLLSFMALLSACSDLGSSAVPGAALVAGSWRWHRTISDHDQHVTFPPSGLVRVDTYSSQGSYSRIENGYLIMRADYDVTGLSTGRLLHLKINWVGGGLMLTTNQLQYWVEVKRDTLRLISSDVYDAFPEIQVFARVR